MTKQITTYTANVTGIAANNIISSASEITARQNTQTAINNTGEVVAENRELLEAIHTTDHVINVTSTSFTGGTNELSILANAITWWDESVYRADKTADASLTGWPSKTITGLTTSNTFYVWATFVSGVKDYEASNVNAALPSNLNEKCLIGIATVNGSGVVSFSTQWNGPITTKNNYFKETQYFLNGLVVKDGFLPANYHDMRIEWVSASQIKILSGSRCRSNDNTVDIVFSSDYTIDMTNATPTSTTGGRTVSELANTWYYLYAGLDSAGLPLAWIDTANLAGGGSVTNPAAFSKGRRQIDFSLRNNISSDIRTFLYYPKTATVTYSDDITGTALLGSGTATVYTTLTATSFIPFNAKRAILDCQFSSTSGTAGTIRLFYLRDGGSSAERLIGQAVQGYATQSNTLDIGLNASVQFDYKNSSNLGAFTIHVLGWKY